MEMNNSSNQISINCIKVILILTFTGLLNSLFSQNTRTSTISWVTRPNVVNEYQYFDLYFDSTDIFALNAISLGVSPMPFMDDMQVEISEYDGTSWTEFVRFEKDHDIELNDKQIFLPYYFNDQTLILRLRSVTQFVATINLFKANNKVQTLVPTNNNTLINECFCDSINFVTRKEWNCPQNNGSYIYAKVTHLIVHHAASTNSAVNWADVVLSIWDFHTRTNGYSDIAYNWLIDPNGVLYEGRGGGENVVGAHFCSKNTGTMGICMLGHLSEANPTQAALLTLQKLLLYKCCNSMLDPTGEGLHASSGLNLQVISGHRDGCATECPGNLMYPRLEDIKSEVIRLMESCQTTSYNEVVPQTGNLNIFPNPSVDGTMNIISEIPISKILVFNSGGQLIKNEVGNFEKNISISNIPSGFHLIKIDFKDGNYTYKKLIFD